MAKKQVQNKNNQVAPLQERLQNHVWLQGFALINLAFGLFGTWAEHKLVAVSGIDLLTKSSSVSDMVAKAFPSTFAISGVVAILAILAISIGLFYTNWPLFQKIVRALPWAQVFIAGFAALTIILYANNSKIKGVHLATGYFWSCGTLIGIALHGLYIAFVNDQTRGIKSDWSKLAMPIAFGVVYIVFLVIHYQYVNYELIKPATELLKIR